MKCIMPAFGTGLFLFTISIQERLVFGKNVLRFECIVLLYLVHIKIYSYEQTCCRVFWHLLVGIRRMW